MYPSQTCGTLRFAASTYAEVVRFSPDGSCLVTGSVDGFIEVWDPVWARLKKELQYQAEEKFMVHESAVLCLAFTRDSELLASGSKDGCLKVWRLRSGQCLRRYPAAHQEGLTAVAFSQDGQHLLSGSFDATIRIHGLKSGKLLKEFRGHTSYVNDVLYSADGSQVISASSDATVRTWDTKSCDCLQVFRPPQTTAGSELSVQAIQLFPQNTEQLVVCNKSNTVFIMTLAGEVMRTFQSGKKEGGDFVAMQVSPKGEYIYCLGEDQTLYCFSTSSGKLEHLVEVHARDVVGLAHHPGRNLVATYSEDGEVKLWKP